MFRESKSNIVLPVTEDSAVQQSRELLAGLSALTEASLDSPLGVVQPASLGASLSALLKTVEQKRALSFLAELSSGVPLPNFIAGKLHRSRGELLDVINPTNAEIIAKVPLSPKEELDLAVNSAKQAQPEWGAKTFGERVEVLYALHSILESRKETLAYIIHLENGKTLAEATQEVDRGISCLKTALSLPYMAAGMIANVGQGISCEEIIIPRGVVAGITPFNFPKMVPMWLAPLAIGCGNAFILKPSEQTPITSIFLAQAFKEAGLPDGIFSVVNGGREMVEAICDHKDIAAIGFIGSTSVAKTVYTRGTANGKVVRALGGAKNHIVVMPDADPKLAVKAIINSSMGCAGQRCMAGSVLVTVGDCDNIVGQVVEAAKQLRLGVDIGSVINRAALTRINSYLERSGSDGTTLLLDGRGFKSEQDTDGFFIGPSIIDNCSVSHPSACEEIFGPVLSIIRCRSLEEAIAIENLSPYGNAASIFTDSASAAFKFKSQVTSGMVGINVGVPVPSEPFSFGGMGYSLFGEAGITAEDGLRFWTATKKVTHKA